MSKPIKIATPLEKGVTFTLQTGKEYSTILKEGEDLTLTIINPNQAKVRCTVKSGKGEVSLYKNGRWVGNYYTISKEPGHPNTVSLNTNTTLDEDAERVIKVDQKEYDEKSTKRSIARQYGVREKDIETKKLQKEIKITIPDSIWELYIVALGFEKNTFKLKLLQE